MKSSRFKAKCHGIRSLIRNSSVLNEGILFQYTTAMFQYMTLPSFKTIPAWWKRPSSSGRNPVSILVEVSNSQFELMKKQNELKEFPDKKIENLKRPAQD